MERPEKQSSTTVKLLMKVYDAKIRKQENREHQKELVLCLWATTIEVVSSLSCEATRSIVEIDQFMQMQVVKEVVKLFETVCERYELKIDYVAMDQVCTWSHY
jgi:hypothetical protein